MRTTSLFAAAVAAALLISGCAAGSFRNARDEDSRCPVKVEAFAAPDAGSKGKIYYLAPAVRDVKGDDLLFLELAGYMENALSKRGYKRVSAEKGADLMIRLGYGAGEPQVSTRIYTTSYGYSYPFDWMRYVVYPEKKASGDPVRTKHLM
ncbi:MAG: hypothetical protein OEU95_01170, partial [Nitrospirota bacterium]|nr:hypothetical protein [Nitrospirota bacterium]